MPEYEAKLHLNFHAASEEEAERIAAEAAMIAHRAVCKEFPDASVAADESGAQPA
jgi:hypothetical protein